ncbi:30S ribosomal protein S2 [Candidatus Woesearchaeota archaeon]|nr:30S ribosomal protein S2 [Candidatus Woesearchaeota archaeon]
MAEEEFLVPTKQYLKAGIHIGTKFRTKYMEQFIYKTRPDGLAILNLQKIDERIGILAEFFSQYAPEDIVVASRRENGWNAVNLFGKYTGVNTFAGRYPPGIMTNTRLDNFMEAKVLLVTDSWPDRNAIRDAVNVGIPVVALCDTNNQATNIDLVIPCNNKGKKSLGLLFYILTKEYLLKRGLIKSPDEFKGTIEEFTEEE